MAIRLTSRGARGLLYRSPSANASRLALIVLLILGCECQSPSRVARSVDPAPVNRLLELIRDRLLLMHDVARYKWNEKKPIADPVREKQLLDGVAEKAKAAGLDPDWVRSFFAAQIEAAKVIQQADFAQWETAGQGAFPDTRDLAVIRKTIDRINGELIAALQESVPQWKRYSTLTVDRQIKTILGSDLDPETRNVAVEPLKRLW